jgi:hypothetical protein
VAARLAQSPRTDDLMSRRALFVALLGAASSGACAPMIMHGAQVDPGFRFGLTSTLPLQKPDTGDPLAPFPGTNVWFAYGFAPRDSMKARVFISAYAPVLALGYAGDLYVQAPRTSPDFIYGVGITGGTHDVMPYAQIGGPFSLARDPSSIRLPRESGRTWQWYWLLGRANGADRSWGAGRNEVLTMSEDRSAHYWHTILGLRMMRFDTRTGGPFLSYSQGSKAQNRNGPPRRISVLSIGAWTSIGPVRWAGPRR